MVSGKTNLLEIFRFAQEMEQIEDEKRHKKPASMVKAVTKIFDSGYEADKDVKMSPRPPQNSWKPWMTRN